MNLTQMERVLFVAQIGNITEAARRLFISQPSLSQSIQMVEEEIGLPLFDRRTQPLRLTYAGEHYVEMARNILDARAAMFERIDEIKNGCSGRINIGLSPWRSTEILPHILPYMEREFPNVSFSLAEGKSAEYERLMLRGSLDFSVGSHPPRDGRISSCRLKNEEYVLVAAPDSSFAARMRALRAQSGGHDGAIPLSLAREERFISIPAAKESHIVFNQMMREARVKPNIYTEAQSTDVAVHLVGLGIGLAVLPVVIPNGAALPSFGGRLESCRIASRYATRELYLFYDELLCRTPVHRRFIELMQESFSPPVHQALKEPAVF